MGEKAKKLFRVEMNCSAANTLFVGLREVFAQWRRGMSNPLYIRHDHLIHC